MEASIFRTDKIPDFLQSKLLTLPESYQDIEERDNKAKIFLESICLPNASKDKHNSTLGKTYRQIADKKIAFGDLPDNIGWTTLSGIRGSKIYGADNVYRDILNSDRVRNSVTYENNNIGINKKEITVMSNNQATVAAALLSRTGVGKWIEINLIHSGFTITLRPIPISVIINMIQKKNNETIRLGRITHTMIFSAMTLLYRQILVEYIIPYIHSYNVSDINKDSITDHIDIRDTPIIMLAILEAQNPNGIDIIRPCVNGYKEMEGEEVPCDGIISETIIPRAMLRLITERIKDEGIMHLRSPKVTMDDIKKYKQIYTSNIYGSRDIHILTDPEDETSGIDITIKSPNITQSIECDNRWIARVIDDAERFIVDYKGENVDDYRNNILEQLAIATLLNAYGSYVIKIKTADGELTQRDYIDSALMELSKNTYFENAFISGIVEYIEETTIAMVGLSAHVCPKCMKIQSIDEKDSITEVIPIDVFELFFAVGGSGIKQRKEKISKMLDT